MVYDVTDFLGMHPGGAGVILQHAGDDATYVPHSLLFLKRETKQFLTSHSEVFKPLHPPNTLEDTLDPSQILGPIDPTTVKPKAPRPLTADEKRVRAAREDLPPVDACVNLEDFERLAEGVLSGTAWAYYRSAGGSALFLGSVRLRGCADFWWFVRGS
jgi:L-lactate dehydrogenase (cytochrome)